MGATWSRFLVAVSVGSEAVGARCERSHWNDRGQVLKRFTVLASLMVMCGCTVGQGGGHVESFGPTLTNECEHTTIAAVAESETLAIERVRTTPTRILHGWRSTVAFDVVDGVRPAELFLAVEVEGTLQPVARLSVSELVAGSVDFVLPVGCTSLVRIEASD